MAIDPIASRYAQAAFEVAQREHHLDETLAQLTAIGELIRGHAALRELMINPDVDPEDKVGILRRLLKGGWSPFMQAFVEMVVGRGRAEYFPQMMDAFRRLADQAQGRLRGLVRSAHPLSEAELTRLRATLEREERKQVQLEPEVAPSLIGGVQLFLGHRVIDGSVQGQMARLRERLQSVRV